MSAYYNENDPAAAAWLQELIRRGLIADGTVDTRSIQNVCAADLARFTQHHFFAGIGGWSLALRRAGWADDQPIWTGSCPCQPFSGAGKGLGFADPRHLWSDWYWLLGQCRPAIVVGEQVASALDWLDIVQTDLEASGYAFGAADLCAAGFEAAHIRQRLYWVAESNGGNTGAERQQRSREQRQQPQNGGAGRVGHPGLAGLEGYRGDGDNRGKPGWVGTIEAGSTAKASGLGRVADADSGECRGVTDTQGCLGDRAADGWVESHGQFEHGGPGVRMADASSARCHDQGQHDGRSPQFSARPEQHGALGQPGPTNAPDGSWRIADWLWCRDDRWRPVEPGTFPLASGLPARVVRLRGYGNAIHIPTAAAFLKAALS